ncbi:MAG TPA: glycosyltransferase family 4 protein [Actinomycetota bacterium]|nr:glycosyltransferase family 4 protein [Actinomycetota bacterium]
MRVTHVAPTSSGGDGLFGGGERYPLELARALAPHVDCRLVTFGTEPTTYSERDGLEVVVLKTFHRRRGHPAQPIARGLAAATRSADVLHVHQMRAAPSRAAAVLGMLRRQKVVATDHGLGGGGWGGLLPRLFHLFLAVSRYSAQTLRAPPSKTRVIYGGADVQRFEPTPREAREGVLFVGRVTPHKGVDLLIRALPEGARLTIAGTTGHDPGSLESDYPALIKGLARTRDVRFVTEASDEELAKLYRSAAVVVLPSVHHTSYGRQVAISELLGLSLLEAMACATPVICSRVGGLPEVMRDGHTGYVVPPGDVPELRARLSEVLSDTDRARTMGANARRHVIEEFTWQRCAQRCLNAYEELKGAT